MRLGPKLLLVLIILLFQYSSFGQSSLFNDETSNDPEIGVVEHLDEFLPEDIYITGLDSQRVRLLDLIDKPTILNFVYYRCPGICSPLMEGLAEVMDKSDLIPDQDYQVLTISFDPTETLELAERKKTNYLNLVNKKEAIAQGWKFYVSDSASIAKSTQAVGFKYKRTGNDFLHAASVMVISPKGKITRYLNGVYFLPFEFKMAIIEANKGQSGPTINKILQFCYSYDPKGQTYVLNVTKVAGTIILFFAIVIFLYLILKPKRKKVY
ncbi:SCO family protein [Sunxiuqinia elliptica]|uniref:Protein SCO1/2 n=1 Tax=Sunxiuqinia elliptica TaxID=655355 RepID=A0A4R6GP59_9BACT|nr:SCO family protein [Sunxiuqinia elliptica]TDN96254.1 protein SCO1/2 [Sunxiuqinia elliptica]TDO67965.1 protein SCO1/2 [Sunxiuqinia elliptica]